MLRSFSLSLFAAASLALLATACDGGTGDAGDEDSDSAATSERAKDINALSGNADDGDPLFQSNCASCHADDATGGSGPNLATETHGESSIQTILDGDGSMPSFDETLEDQEIADIIAWLNSL